MRSDMHSLRCNETAAADEMIGQCSSLRRFSSIPGLTGPLSMKSFKAFWGSRIREMPRIVLDRLSRGTKIEVDMPHWGKKAKKVLEASDIRSIGLVAVSYKGDGKYNSSSSPEYAVRWDDLIESQDEEVEDIVLNLAHQLPAGSGWWPACIVNWHTMHEDHGFSDHTEYYAQVCCGVMCIYVICWYQLMDGEWALTAWPILFTQIM